MKHNKIVIGITQGDTNGIGYEVIIKALADPRIGDLCVPIVYGSSRAMGYYKKMIPEVELNSNVINTARDYHPKRVNIINCIEDNFHIEPGQFSGDAAKAAVTALERVVEDMKEGMIDAIVTAPFNKRGVSKEKFLFPGHTEYLTNQFGAKDGLMFLCSDNMRVGLATGHVPISKVPQMITKDLLMTKLRLMNNSLLEDFDIVKPKIAVLGLNPHAGDGGLLGNEEQEYIIPAVQEANKEGILAFGPYSPDGFFATNMQYKFDAVLAMYHDQGLIPFKSLAFDSGVNFTAGLSVVRTSPDHGTAYELAGKNMANPQSMVHAIYTAIDIVRNRRKYKEMREDSLKITYNDHQDGRRNRIE